MNFRVALKKHLLPLDGKTLIADYRPKRLKALQQHLARDRRNRNYINAVCARVKRMFKWGVSEGIVPPSIYHALATVPGLRKDRSTAVESVPREPVEWQHVEAVLPELSATVAAMVLLQWHTGVRSQSICQARRDQFNLDASPWEWRPRHKTEALGKSLVVYVGPQAQDVLRPFLARPKADYLFQPKHLNGERAAGYRSFYDSVSYLRAIRRAIERVNRQIDERNEGKPEPERLPRIPYWTPHQLRHAKATRVRAAYGIEAAQASTGHARLSSAQIYAKRSEELARQVACETG
jgi:integrase